MCANSLRHVIFENIKINLKLAIIFAHVSIFICVVKNSGEIGQSQENCDKIKFRAQFSPKDDNYDRIHQITLPYKKYSNSAPFFAIIEILEFATFEGQSQKIVYRPISFQNISMKLPQKLHNRKLQKVKKVHVAKSQEG